MQSPSADPLQHDVKHPSLHFSIVELAAEQVSLDGKLDLGDVEGAVGPPARDDAQRLLLLQAPGLALLELHKVLQHLDGLLHVQPVQVQAVVVTLRIPKLQ